MSVTLNMAAAALAYARIGLQVFPVWPALAARNGNGFICGCGRLNCDRPAKHPIGRLAPHGLDDATADEARIHHLWAARPDANIGLRTGEVLAIDVDPRHGGTLEAVGKTLPLTWRAATGGGGTHVYFRSDGTIGNSVGTLAAGIDVRGARGYTILPPSTHITGSRYSWEPNCAPDDLALAPLPAAIAAKLAAANVKVAAGTTADWQELVKNNVGEGARNVTIAKLAGHLLRRYVDSRVVLQLLLAWNVTRCNPPLSAAEVARTINSIAGKELRRRNAPR